LIDPLKEPSWKNIILFFLFFFFLVLFLIFEVLVAALSGNVDVVRNVVGDNWSLNVAD
jgi:hypothetical protein